MVNPFFGNRDKNEEKKMRKEDSPGKTERASQKIKEEESCFATLGFGPNANSTSPDLQRAS
jgi:hypothetical protein